MATKINRHTMERRRPPAAGTDGFTLLEVLIAVTLLAVLLAALYASFFVAHRAATAGDEVLQTLQELRSTLDIMRRELEATKPEERDAFPFRLRDRDFYGQKASQLEFTTFASHIPGTATLEYFVVESDDRLSLIKSARPSHATEEEALQAELIEDVVSFDVQCFNGQSWLTTWNERSMPKKIKVVITARMEGRTITMSEIIIPRINNPL